MDGAVGVVCQFRHFEAPEPCLTFRRYAVVVEQIPFPFIFYDGVVCGPSHYGCEDDPLIGEWAIGVVAHGIANQVGVTGGVGEVIFSIVTMHPGGLEEATFGITGCQGFPILIKDHQVAGFLAKLQHILSQTHYLGAEGLLITFR